MKRFNNKLSTSRGFTFIELLVVIAVLAILIALTVFLINPALQFKKGRDAQRKSDLRQIQAALEMYRSDNGGYPNSIALNCPLVGIKTYFGNPACTLTYLQKVPADPNQGINYYYFGASNNYCIRACVENTQDSDRDELPGKYGSTNPSITACLTLTTCTTGTTGKSYTLQNP
ncbi:MAG: prepilin-type N-terminal cleavage/methylation domain-containing protein [Candidatus Levybacteria bacterium]|nr:prepilin-type N-terminal cleavage/methylation domain-containing protein [Candidatus Levybacteria bacterium]